MEQDFKDFQNTIFTNSIIDLFVFFQPSDSPKVYHDIQEWVHIPLNMLI